MTRFIPTKQYKKFREFCKTCERDNYIGLCYGPAGAGKTQAARHYTKWHHISEHLDNPDSLGDTKLPISNSHCALYTPSQLHTPKEVIQNIHQLIRSYGLLKERTLFGNNIPLNQRNKHFAKLVIIDESERLKSQAFEIIREIYDAGETSFIFIGMPGIEKTLAWYPQLYSRIGFVHKFDNMDNNELKFILNKHLLKLGDGLRDDDFADQEVVAYILRMTGGNFRLVDRLIKQSLRIMKVNSMETITKEIVEAARSCLLIGSR